MGAPKELLKRNGEQNKGKTFRKTPYKKKSQKYLTLEEPLIKELEERSKETGLSQSYIMALALIDYFDKIKKNDKR